MTDTKGNSALTAQLDKLAGNKEQDTDTPKWQTYSSARISTRLITPFGARINFTNHKFITQDEALIEYLDSEIKSGLTGITKGELLSTEDLDPMAALRREMKEEAKKELLAEAIAQAKGETKDMGSTENSPKIKPASSKNVAN